MADGTVRVQPGLTIAPRDWALTVTVTMDDYTNAQGQPITATGAIYVTVLKCVVSIDTSSSTINDIFYHRWGYQEPSIRVFALFQYTAACNLEFTYEAKLRIDQNTLVNLPSSEIVFDANSN